MRKAISLLAIIVGLTAIFGGPMLGLGLAIMARSGARQGAGLQETAVVLALAVVGIGCGALLTWAGLAAYSKPPGGPLRLLHWAWWLLLGLLLLAAGGLGANRGNIDGLLPILHVLTNVVFVLFFLSLTMSAAGASPAGVGARSAAGSLGWGALGAASVAMVIEAVFIIILAVVAGLWLGFLRPDLLRELQTWAQHQIQSPGAPFDLGPLRSLATSPVLVFVGLVSLGLGVPLIEELAKSAAVPLAGLAHPGGVRSLSRMEAFLLGVASGAGFALLEGMLNGSLGLASPGNWWVIMAARSGTIAIHCLATGFGGLAWQAALVRRRWMSAAGWAVLAVMVHGVWNAGTGITGLAGLLGGASSQSFGLGAALQIMAAGCMGVFWLAIVLALPLTANRLAAEERVELEAQTG